jgi:hypothetical protein
VTKVGEKWEVAVKVGTEFEVVMPESRKWWSKWVQNLKRSCAKMENGGQSVRNRECWSRWVQNLKWPCVKIEIGCQNGCRI